MTTLNRTVSTLLLAILAVASLPSLSQGQTRGGSGGKPVSVPDNTRSKSPSDSAAKPTSPPASGQSPVPASPKSSIAAVPMADSPLHIDSVGLSVSIPLNAKVDSTIVGGRTTVQIVPEDQSWIMNIQTPVTSNERATVADAAQQTIALLQGSVGVLDKDNERVLSTDARIIDRIDDLTLPGGRSSRFYVSLPEAKGNARVVKGYTIFKPGPKQYVVFELICGEPFLEKARGAYETTVGTATFASSDALMLDRMGAIKSGVAFFSQLSEQDFNEAMGSGENARERWYRFYKPSPDGNTAKDEELGYVGIKFWHGKRGEIDSSRRISDFSPVERQEGLLVRVRSRILAGQAIGDNEGIFFMTPDRSEEAWSFKTAARESAGKQKALASETGARLNDSLQVIRAEPGKPTTTISPPILSEGYISQFETFLLPRLMAHKKIEGDFGFYAYQAWPAGTVTFRKDTFRREKTSGEDVYTLTSRIRDDADVQVTTIDASGNPIEVVFKDGAVRQAIDLPTLKQIWQQKRLPLE